ncbi:gliding motility lipoprotein GldB [Sabulilitoribacter arenilitoris]|uniref:Gliding motility lipoprotein GldB n=1 Tax=Wocania arenilitoris TaxID=2044858 RepID=A0AAE3EN86_9FLAO|nr:gliding motility lipoprotein GldB [Wocania arenilitoris]MCF7567572.1 gliding motility lipoprotein GldB [Wocania arenilitoris]
MKNTILLFGIFLIAVSCKKESQLQKNIAKINTDISVERFDKLFAEADSKELPNLKKAYPFMFSEKYSDSFWLAKKADTLQIQLFDEVAKAFPTFENTEAEIESLFNHLKYYFPEFNPPRVITVTNDVDYRNRVIVTDTIALIALDNYLGSDHDFYVYGNIDKYIRQNLKKEQLVVDLASKYAKKYIYQSQKRTLLDEMIYYGKQLYFKDMVIPFKTDAERISYSQEELDWAIANESYIWRYFVERELLFSTDSKLPSRFINPAPFTKFYLEKIDHESPGRLGQYIGWQIVRAYMKQNNISLKDMLIKSTEDIFNNTKFKPRK